MVMRVASGQIYDNLLAGVRQQTTTSAESNARLSSGTRFQRPAEAGVDYRVSLDLRHFRNVVDGGLSAVQTAQTRLSISAGALASMADILGRAQTLAVQQTSANNSGQRAGAIAEMKQLGDQLLALANSRWQGQSLFGGTALDRDAFVRDAAGNVAYNGNTQDVTVAVDANTVLPTNVRGDAAAFGAAFAAVKSFSDALAANNLAGMQTALGALNSAGNALIDLNAETGARHSSLDLRKTALSEMKTTLEQRQNDHEGVDAAAEMIRIQQADVALKAAYSQISALRSMSLVNFLG